jgi:hypothetical protein
MKVICGPKGYPFESDEDVLQVILYGNSDPDHPERASVGASVKQQLSREKLAIDQRAWDFLSLALSVVTADLAELRDRSPDGWTRVFELTVAVTEPDFWNSQRPLIEKCLAFLTTDCWHLQFVAGGDTHPSPCEPFLPVEDCAILLSGGLDSLIGCIDLVKGGLKPLVVSQLVRGDAEKQSLFAEKLGPLKHLLLNHNASAPESQTTLSQRSRSLIFIAFGVVSVTSPEPSVTPSFLSC